MQLHSIRKVTPLLGLSVLFVAGVSRSEGQTWQPLVTANWSDASNWLSALPANDGTADVVFSSLGSVQTPSLCILDADWNVRSLRLNLVGVSQLQTTTPGKTLTLQAGIFNESAGTFYITPNIVIPTMQQWNDTSPNGSGKIYVGNVAGAGGIEKVGTGTLYLPAGNSYAGGTRVLGGIVVAAGTGAFGTGQVQLVGAEVQFTPAATAGAHVSHANAFVLEGAGGVLSTPPAGLVELTGQISGAAPLTLRTAPGQTAALAQFYIDRQNLATGPVTISGAAVVLGSSGSGLGAGSISLVGAGSTLSLAGAASIGVNTRISLEPKSSVVIHDEALNPAMFISRVATTGGILTIGKTIYGATLDMAQIGHGLMYLGANKAATYAAPTLGAGSDGVYRLGGGTVEADETPNLIIAGHDNVLTGARSVVINESGLSNFGNVRTTGTVTLRNANNYSQGTTLKGGTLEVDHDQALGSGAVTWENGLIDGGAEKRIIPNDITLTFSSLSRSIRGDDVTFTGLMDLGGQMQNFFSQSGGFVKTITLAGPIVNGGLNLSSGKWILEGPKTFAGGFTATQAVIGVGDDASLGAPGGSVVLDGARLIATNSFTSPRTIGISGFGLAIDTAEHDVEFTGGFQKALGAIEVNVSKTGSGKLTLSGSPKTLTRLTISAGTVEINHIGVPSITVAGGGTLMGTGGVGSTSLAAGARLRPGTAAEPGTFVMRTGLGMKGSSILEFELGIVSSDQIVFTHSGPFADVETGEKVFIDIVDAGGLALDQRYVLIDWTDGSDIPLSADDFMLTSSPVPGTFEVVDRTLQFVTVPEPGMGSLVIGGLAAMGLHRRRRKSSC